MGEGLQGSLKMFICLIEWWSLWMQTNLGGILANFYSSLWFLGGHPKSLHTQTMAGPLRCFQVRFVDSGT